MGVNLGVESYIFLVFGSSTLFAFLAFWVVSKNMQANNRMHIFLRNAEKMGIYNSILELLQKDNFAVVAAMAASIKSYNKKSKQ